MGITIHWDMTPTEQLTGDKPPTVISLIRSLAAEAGYEFFETSEKGYMGHYITRLMDGTELKTEYFIGEDWHHGDYPKQRMNAIREGEQKVDRESILVNPLNTESFELSFITRHDKLISMEHGFCKTQAFSGEDASVNARSHIWVINALCMVKRILPDLNITDESDFYEEGKELHEMNIENIEESFDENLALINRVSEELNKEMPGLAKVGVQITKEQAQSDAIKSTGTPMTSKEYLYTIWEKGEIIYQETIEKDQAVVIDINVPKEGCGDCPGESEEVCETCTGVGDHEESCPELKKEQSLTELSEELDND